MAHTPARTATPLARLRVAAGDTAALPDRYAVDVRAGDVRAVLEAVDVLADAASYADRHGCLVDPATVEAVLRDLGARLGDLEDVMNDPDGTARALAVLDDFAAAGSPLVDPEPSPRLRSLVAAAVDGQTLEITADAREAQRAAGQAALEREAGLPPEPSFITELHRMGDRAHLTAAHTVTTTLGALTDALRDARSEAGDDAPVHYAGCGLDGQIPWGVGSWRGVYADLALEHVTPGPTSTAVGRVARSENTVTNLIATLIAAEGAAYEGWKGGDYTMSRSTPVWVDNRGQWNPDRALTGVSAADGTVLLHVTEVQR